MSEEEHPTSKHSLSRRQLLQAAGAGGLALALGRKAPALLRSREPSLSGIGDVVDVVAGLRHNADSMVQLRQRFGNSVREAKGRDGHNDSRAVVCGSAKMGSGHGERQ